MNSIFYGMVLRGVLFGIKYCEVWFGKSVRCGIRSRGMDGMPVRCNAVNPCLFLLIKYIT